MKKILISVLSILICFSMLSSVSAKSVEPIDKGGQITNNGYSFEIDYEEERGRVIYGPNGIDIICADRKIHLDTTFEVKKLISVGDLNSDGYTDFFAYENASEFTDQIFTIDGKSGKVMASTRYTHSNYSDTLGEIWENSYILKMVFDGMNVLLIADYNLICVNPSTCESLAVFCAEDNIWDFEIFDSYVVVSDQTGTVNVLDRELNVICTRQIAKPYDVQYAYYDPEWSNYIERILAGMSAFDVYKDDCEPDVAYVTTQDGCLWRFDLNTLLDEGETVSKIRSTDDEEFEQSISYEYQERRVIDGIKYGTIDGAGLFSYDYMNYRIVDSNDKYLLIGCNISDEESLVSSESGDMMEYTYYSGASAKGVSFEVYNRKTGECIEISPAEMVTGIDALLVTYNETEAVMIASVTNAELHIFVNDFSGNVLYQKTLTMSAATGNRHIKLSALDEGYMVEVLKEGISILDGNLDQLKDLYKKSSSELLQSNDEGYTLVFAENRNKTKIEHYDNSGNVLWTYVLANDGNYHGMEGLQCVDFNKDGVTDYIFAAINYDAQNQPTWARYIVVNGADGSTMRNSTIVSYTYYDEHWHKVTVYLTSSSIDVVEDWDNDGCRELIIDGVTISSKNMSCKGYVDVDIYDEGVLRQIGDANGDGVEDYLLFAANNKLATMYCSSISNYNVVYYRQNKTITLNPKADNLNYAVVFGDINGDGTNEVLINNYNAKNYQVVDVYDGKSLSKLYTLYEEGVSDYEVLTVSDFDLNGDGYYELVGTTGSYWCGEIFDGKTGERKFYFPFYEDEYFTTESEYYHPDYLIQVMTDKESQQLIPMDAGDINGDGIHDLMYTTTDYNYQTYESDTVLILRSGSDYTLIEKVVLPSAQRNYSGTLVGVRNSDDLLAIKFGNSVSLLNKSGELIADYSLKANEFIYVDEKTVLAITDGSVYRLNTEDSFMLIGGIEEQTDDYRLNLSWQPLVDYSVMKIYDNNTLVYYGSDCETTIRLLQGEHKITMSLSDGDGKSSNAVYTVNVKKQSNSYTWMIALSVLVLAVAVTVALYRKIYIRKNNISHSAEKEVK